jgi:Second Messenger Oligonucleotide or Dinucleotide Synthetase domain
MGIAKDFQDFCGELIIKDECKITARCNAITKRLNLDFWGSESERNHRIYVGSYGRDTAIGVSDLDIIFTLPYRFYVKYNNYLYNGQSSLLQSVKVSIHKTYPNTYTGGDGQVVVVSFADGMKFEIVPAFEKEDGSFTYPDSNDGGKWKVTNPKPEINSIQVRNIACNYNLKPLCRMTRAWKNYWNVPMGGLLIDTLAYNFIANWEYKDKSYLYYDYMSRDFFLYLANQDPKQSYWRAAGSSQYIWRKGLFEYKAKQCYKLAMDAIAYESNGMNYSARKKWREIYGTAYPI